MHDHFTIRIEFADPVRQVIQGNQVAADVSGLVLMRVSNIKDENILTCIEPLFEIFGVDLWEFGQWLPRAAVAAW